MEGTGAQGPRGNRPRPYFNTPNSPRAYVRSSSRTSSARMPSQKKDGSSSNLTSSPSLRNIQPAVVSRPSTSKGSMGSNVERPPTPIATTSTQDSQSSSKQEPQSTLLQERLQQQRRSEIQRNLNRLAGEMSGSGAAGSRAATATPRRSDIADVGRPGSKDGGGDTGTRGLALKEMEQVCCQPPVVATQIAGGICWRVRC